MKRRGVARLIAALAVCAISACATAPDEPPPTAAQESAAKPAPRPAEPQAVTPGRAIEKPESSAAAETPQAPAGAPAQRSVYFDFDRFDIKDEYRALIEANARYLRDNANARAAIQGHADERGSREYNIGLGQRRAESVMKALVLLGARENQLEAVSFGEEKPVCTEPREDCWQRNRRAEIVHGAR